MIFLFFLGVCLCLSFCFCLCYSCLDLLIRLTYLIHSVSPETLGGAHVRLPHHGWDPLRLFQLTMRDAAISDEETKPAQRRGKSCRLQFALWGHNRRISGST